MQSPIPSAIKIHKKSAELGLYYAEQESFRIPFELLRVYSPSAEVRPHQSKRYLPLAGKADVQIQLIETTGNYGIQIYFDDGHHTGIYSWDYLYDLAKNNAALMQAYLSGLEQAGKTRFKQQRSLHSLKATMQTSGFNK